MTGKVPRQEAAGGNLPVCLLPVAAPARISGRRGLCGGTGDSATPARGLPEASDER